jgi:hypothetical protein
VWGGRGVVVWGGGGGGGGGSQRPRLITASRCATHKNVAVKRVDESARKPIAAGPDGCALVP